MIEKIKNHKILQIITHLRECLQGKETAIILSLISIFSRGHLLIEDFPGLGKTSLAIALSKVLNLSFGRIQCTNDLLPTDITGLSVYNKNSGEFEFKPGPLLNNIVLVDEINRATPKTQSALLEAMAEEQVTVDGKTYKLPKPFFVIATQNPIEIYGTFPLPESQLDRFMMKISIGYPPKEAEKEILQQGSSREKLYKLNAIMDKDEIIRFQEEIRQTYLSDKIIDWILDFINLTRQDSRILLGLSTRAGIAITYTAKTYARFRGRDYVIPEDVKEMIPFVVPHRIILKENFMSKEEVISSILKNIPTPP
ncbi:MAG: MoxR family ATPase [Thermodesulfovibrio sp.]|nr:MoxR family ATPase [Thermodesulfovibrio sp.]MCX7723959.1 MoxR family ATPase [Thermodesulfovibrio sp.]MDW7972142.1 MoxR family ATPase [Thermodesulfovibrio sp.]